MKSSLKRGPSLFLIGVAFWIGAPSSASALDLDLNITMVNLPLDAYYRLGYGIGVRIPISNHWVVAGHTSILHPYTVAGYTQLTSFNTVLAQYVLNLSRFSFAGGAGFGLAWDGILGAGGGWVPGPVGSIQVSYGGGWGIQVKGDALLGIFDLTHVSYGVYWNFFSMTAGPYFRF